MNTYYNNTCPACGSSAYIDNMIDAENDRQEDICLCTNTTCANFDVENLGPKRLTELIETARTIGYHIDQVNDGMNLLKRQAEEIARMGMVKVETLIKNKEKRK